MLRIALLASLAAALLIGTLPAAPSAQAEFVDPPLDVQVSLSWVPQEPIDAPHTFRVRLTVTNPWNSPAWAVAVTGAVPDGSTFVSAGGYREASHEAVTWTVHELWPGQTAGPFEYRISTGIERAGNAAVHATATWAGPSPGSVRTPALSLRGLIGEPALTKSVLPGGLTLLTLERPDTRTVATRVAVRAGARDEDDTTAGGSHWLEHAHFLGTEKYSGGLGEIDAAIEGVGGSMNATTGSELTTYFNLVPAQHFDLALEVLSQLLLHSTFPREAFERERRVVFEELKRREDSPSVRAFDAFLGTVFQQSPLRRNPGGTIESVQAIPIETILGYRDQRYVTGNTVIAVAGSIVHTETLRKVGAAFAPMRRGDRVPRSGGMEPPPTAPHAVEIGDGSRGAEVLIGVPVAGLDSDDRYALTLLDEVLDGAGRRLATEIRELRGLASQVGTSLSLYSDGGFWAASISTTPANVHQVRDIVLAEVERLKHEPLSEAELEATVRFLLGRRILAEESNNSQAGRLASGEALGSLESAEEYARRIRRVTPQDLLRVAQQYFDTQHYSLVVVRS